MVISEDEQTVFTQYAAAFSKNSAQFCCELLGAGILELLWPARRKFGDRLADFDWIKCGHRLEWVGYELGNCSPMTWTRCGHAADNPRPRPLPVHGQLNPLPVRGHGQFANVVVGVDKPRMRTVRGHGQFEFVAGTEPDHDR